VKRIALQIQHFHDEFPELKLLNKGLKKGLKKHFEKR
jgi:hypothetical protein